MTSIEHPVVYIDSDVEQAAWIYAQFGPDGSWQTVSQTMTTNESGELQEVLEIQLVNGDLMRVPFMEATPDESLEGLGIDRTSAIEDMMEIAAQYAQANPPHHPGSLPRFPVPASGYENAIAVPMAILAVDDEGLRGLYEPPRSVVMTVGENALIGIGDFPGFDPEEMWPPARVGDWPPAKLYELPEQQLQGIIERFSCCWSRVLEAYFLGKSLESPILRADIQESLSYRSTLDCPGFDSVYERLNPAFSRWLQKSRD